MLVGAGKKRVSINVIPSPLGDEKIPAHSKSGAETPHSRTWRRFGVCGCAGAFRLWLALCTFAAR